MKKKFYRKHPVYKFYKINLENEKFFSNVYFLNFKTRISVRTTRELLFENIIKSLIVLPNGYKSTIKKIKITRYPSSFNFHSIFPGYTYPRLIVDRNLVAVQRSITRNRDFFLFFRRELLIAYVNGAAAGSKTFYQALGKIQYRNRGLKRGHIGALLFNSFTNSRLQQSNRSPIFPSLSRMYSKLAAKKMEGK